MVHYLLTHRWSWGTSDEIGVHTLAIETAQTDPILVLADAISAWTTAVASTANLASAFSSSVNYQTLVVNEITNLSTGAMNAGFQDTIVLNGSGGDIPPQVAEAVSISGGFYPNGRPIRGRFYLPPVDDNSFTANGILTPGVITILGGFVENYFTELNGYGLTPSVWSRTLGVMNPITSARIGNVADTIRSRRNNLGETYTAIPV